MASTFKRNYRIAVYGLLIAVAFAIPYPFNVIQAVAGAVMLGICIGVRLER